MGRETRRHEEHGEDGGKGRRSFPRRFGDDRRWGEGKPNLIPVWQTNGGKRMGNLNSFAPIHLPEFSPGHVRPPPFWLCGSSHEAIQSIFSRPFGTRFHPDVPGSELPGYCRKSLRDDPLWLPSRSENRLFPMKSSLTLWP